MVLMVSLLVCFRIRAGMLFRSCSSVRLSSVSSVTPTFTLVFPSSAACAGRTAAAERLITARANVAALDTLCNRFVMFLSATFGLLTLYVSSVSWKRKCVTCLETCRCLVVTYIDASNRITFGIKCRDHVADAELYRSCCIRTVLSCNHTCDT